VGFFLFNYFFWVGGGAYPPAKMVPKKNRVRAANPPPTEKKE
jgi:hypothetical protein